MKIGHIFIGAALDPETLATQFIDHCYRYYNKLVPTDPRSP